MSAVELVVGRFLTGVWINCSTDQVVPTDGPIPLPNENWCQKVLDGNMPYH